MKIWTLNLLAQAAGEAPAEGPAEAPGLLGPGMTQALMLALMFVVLYFLLTRPQRTRQKQHEKMVAALKTGDRVVVVGGIHGVIANVKDKTVVVKIAENTKIEVDRGSIGAVLQENS